jgi:hypothetical protein
LIARAALSRHALLNVVIAVESLEETVDEDGLHEPARHGFAVSAAERGEDHEALHALFLHRLDAVFRTAGEIVGRVLDRAWFRCRADDHGIVTRDRGAHGSGIIGSRRRFS